MTKIIKEIDIAVKELLEGNVVGLPTETVYGLGANALNDNAVLKIYETKDRPKFNPVIVHVKDINEIEKYAQIIPDEVFILAEKFSPGPITFVLKKNNLIPDIVTAGNDSIGLRIPAHRIFMEVLQESDIPLAAPSANRAGSISPTSAGDVMSELKGRINYVLDGGKCEVGIESTIVGFLNDEIKILRHGSVSKNQIEKVTGKIISEYSGKIISPGLLKSHYAPDTPLYCVEDFDEINNLNNMKAGILDFSKYQSLKDIAANLYSDLRNLDSENYDLIVYVKTEDSGLGVAINDRLERASSGKLKNIYTNNFTEK